MATNSRELFSTGTVWEREVGYSRAIKLGDRIFVSGTTATLPSGELAGIGDAYIQTKQTIENIRLALEQAGATLADLIRYRVYLTRREDVEDACRALGEAFLDTRPTGTLIGIAWLIDPRMLIEIDAEAIINNTGADESRA